MLTFAAPAFLLAGTLAMLVPLALHLIRRRPLGRVPLPTARFLAEDPRNAVRVSRPTDLLLLVLRMLLLLLVGAAFSRPAWIPAPKGTSAVVLLDQGSGVDAEAWRIGLSMARQALLGPGGEARGELVLFDSAAVHLPRTRVRPELFDSLLAAGPGRARSDYAVALRAIPSAARALRGADSVTVQMISPLSSAGWSPGLGALRESAWPGAIQLTRLPMARDTATRELPASSRRAYVVAGEGGRFVSTALGALGYQLQVIAPTGLSASADTITPDSGAYFVLTQPDRPTARELSARVRRGASLVVASTAIVDSGAWSYMMPWDGPFTVRPNSAGGTMWLGADLRIGGAAGRVEGRTAEGAWTIAAWDDGRPAATAMRGVRGCSVYVGTALEGGDLPFQAEYPAMLGRLARGCESRNATMIGRPLDSGAVQVLRGRG
ncbi:BatA domain-containing protein, partial [Longimicrobium sp.]|uniref:BatA domain-containing protein n=1 Tax=Longimicrobium sp. TaxID=2029185 RepID=UPI002F946E16